MATELVLSLFPGAGVLDGAFVKEGYCVVRGPDLLWGQEIANFHPPANRFEGVIAGIPATLVHEFERVVNETRPRWWVAEIGRGAPLPSGAEGEQMIGARRFLWSGLSNVAPVQRLAQTATQADAASFMASFARETR